MCVTSERRTQTLPASSHSSQQANTPRTSPQCCLPSSCASPSPRPRRLPCSHPSPTREDSGARGSRTAAATASRVPRERRPRDRQKTHGGDGVGRGRRPPTPRPYLPGARWAPVGASAGCAPLRAIAAHLAAAAARPAPALAAELALHGARGWSGAPGSSSSWRRLLRLSRLTNGSSPIPAPRPRALPPQPPFSLSAPSDRPNWFLRSGLVPPVSLRQPRPPRRAGVGGGPSRRPSLCPSWRLRGARRRNPGLADAARVAPRALGVPRRQAGALAVACALPVPRPGSCGRSRLPDASASLGTTLATPPTSPASLFRCPPLPWPPLGVGDRASPKSCLGHGSPGT